MTFAEKLVRLRKRAGMSQESLAETVGVSRQAVSRWEQGTALPDAAKLLPCARLFGVSADWLLDDSQGWEDTPAETAPDRRSGRGWYIAGGLTAAVGALGMVVMGILSAVFPVEYSESAAAPAEGPGAVVYDGFSCDGLVAFLRSNRVEWLFALCGAVVIAGLFLLAAPTLRERERGISRFSPLWSGGVAGCFCALGNQFWQYQTRGTDMMLLWLYLAVAAFCAARLLTHINREPNPQRRRRDQVVVALYLTAQAVLLLLTAEIGLGLVGLALHGGLAVLTAWEMIWQGVPRRGK